MQQSLKQFEKIYSYTFSTDVEAALTVRVFERHDRLMVIGERVEGFLFLLSGSYYVTSPESNGKELLLRRCTVPSIMGDVERFEQCDVQSNCIASERCVCLFVPFALYEQTLQHDAAFTTLLLQELAFKLRTCTVLSRVNALSSVHVKLAAYLCTVYEDNRDHYLIVEHMRDIAPLLGTTNRHINRILKKWTEEQIVQRTAHTITVLDIEKLSHIADGVRYT